MTADDDLALDCEAAGLDPEEGRNRVTALLDAAPVAHAVIGAAAVATWRIHWPGS